MALAIVTQIVIACCSCKQTTFGKYTHKSIDVVNLDTSGSEIIVARSNAVFKNSYGIELLFHRSRIACAMPVGSLFISTSYAHSCSCPPEVEILAQDSITQVHVITLRDFDESHPAGSDISDYFKIRPYGNSYNTLKYYDSVGAENYTSDLNHKADNLDRSERLLLMTPPAIGKLHIFKVQVRLSDGRVLQAKTPEVELL